MATVGLNFGSASSGAGFDVASTVTSILAIEQGVESPWKTRTTVLQAQDAALSTLGTGLSTLSTALDSLTSFDGIFAAKQGSSSNTNVLTLTGASASAVAGSHTVVVNSLAQTSSTYSDRVTNATDTLSGSLSLSIGSGAAQTITIDPSNNTLQSLATAINNGAYGITASVVQDTLGSRLSFVSKSSGTAGQITLASNLSDQNTASNIGFAVGQTGADAHLNVDGLDTTSASNTVTGAIPGVTFQLLSSSPSNPLQIQITNDNASIETAVRSLVSAYNAVVGTVKLQEGKDANGNAEPLFGDPALAQVQTQLTQALFGGSASGSVKNIAQLGLTANVDGTLKLDVSVLDSALNKNFSDVTGFFQNAGSFGLGFSQTLNQLGAQSVNGSVHLALQQNAGEEATLAKNIVDTELRIATDRKTLTAELSKANQILQSIPTQLDELNKIYGAVTGYVAPNN